MDYNNQQDQQYVPNQQYQPYNMNSTNNIPEEYKPISMWGYFGYQLLFCIPCVGFIMLLVFAFGGTQNINLKNFARSYFCIWVLSIILLVVFWVIIGALGLLANM